MRQVRIGKVVLTDGGAWSASKSYAVLTFVRHNGDGWWSAKANVNSEPVSGNTNWVQATDVQSFISAMQSATSTAVGLNETVAAAESSRSSAETARNEAESARVSAEAARVSAESGRVSAESTRASAETARQMAEGNRESRYTSAESSRNSTYGIAEAGRNYNFEQAQTARQATFESAESSRVSAEDARVSAESSRVSAETARQSAETTRQQTFEVAIGNVNTATELANDVVIDFNTVFTSLCEDPNIVRLSGRVVNVVSATTTAVVAYKGSGNGDTYRVVASGSTALKEIIGLSVKCPAFAVGDNAVEQVMSVEFVPSVADFSLALVNASGDTVSDIPWVDKVAPVYSVGDVHVLTVSRMGVSVSKRVTSNLYGE